MLFILKHRQKRRVDSLFSFCGNVADTASDVYAFHGMIWNILTHTAVRRLHEGKCNSLWPKVKMKIADTPEFSAASFES
jgi:hypothetical protein